MADSYLETSIATTAPAHFPIGRVAILMCTKNGGAFIDDQLKSIAEQSYENWILIVSDDGSDDETIAKIQAFAAACPQRVLIRKGPAQGVCANFLSLANDPTIKADYFAFSDQDDIWHHDKLSRALAWLTKVPVDVPALYCGRTELMTKDGRSCGFSPLFVRQPAFQNALVQSLAGGNTMVFNRATKKILEQAATTAVVVHDWWVYQLVSAADGRVYYDQQPMLRYRQHSENMIGANTGWSARLVRLGPTLTGRFRDWNEMNIAALRKLSGQLITPKSRKVLYLFARARTASFFQRLYLIKKAGIYRQTWLGDLGLILAAFLNKI